MEFIVLIQNRLTRLKNIDHITKHRGKDAYGVVARNNNLLRYIFAHRRLIFILDLSNNSDQPLIDKNNKTMIVFNGEIYNFKDLRDIKKSNYKFYTNSDTEVLLYCYAEWGINLLNFLKVCTIYIWDELKTLSALEEFE